MNGRFDRDAAVEMAHETSNALIMVPTLHDISQFIRVCGTCRHSYICIINLGGESHFRHPVIEQETTSIKGKYRKVFSGSVD